MPQTVYDFSAIDIKGETLSLKKFEGKALLIVNTASQCGFTKQYDGLQKMYEELNESGLEILGFPCNQFGKQESGTDEEISTFCTTRFSVKFPLFSKVEVNGSNCHPLYEHLKKNAPGLLGSKTIKWNFTKFLVDKQGHVLKRFAPKDTPESIKIEVEKLLKS
jgi:glutathione peroxidase